MKENFVKLSQNLILVAVIAASAAAVLLFLPTTSEFFEYNKFTFILIVTVIGLITWSIKMVIEKRTVFTRTPLDIPILILIAVLIVSAFSSIDQFVSFFGTHGRIWPSVFPYITLGALYYLTVTNLKSKKQVTIVLWALVLSTLIAALLAISSYFGAFLPFDFAQLRSFNTLGIVNRLAILESLVLPISAYFAIFQKDKIAQVAATLTTLIIAFSLILINFLPAYIALIITVAFSAFTLLKVKLTKTQQGTVAVLAVFIALFLVIRYVPQVARGTLSSWITTKDKSLAEEQLIDTPKEKALGMRSAWDIAAQSLGKRPLLGTGVGTYQFVYTQLKPRYINSTDDWVIRFDKSSSEFTDILATTGIIGTLAYLVFLVAIIRLIWTLVVKSPNLETYLPLTLAILAYIVASFLAPSSFALATVFFVLLALLAVAIKASDEDHVYDVTVELATLKNKFAWFPIGATGNALLKTEAGAKGTKSQVLPILFTLVILIASILALNYQISAYRADYFYRQALLAARANDGNRTVDFLQKAIAANPRIDTYHREFSQTALNAAINLSQQKNLNDNQKQLLSNLAQVAIDQGKAASGYQILPLRLPGISAANVANWEALSSVYQALIGAIGGSDVHATNTLAQAVALDPENPILHLRLGQLYQRLGNQDLAQRKFEDSIVVKGDYGPGHYALANILIDRQGDVARIVNELTLAKRFLPSDDPARKDIDGKLDKYNTQLRDLQEKQNKQPQASPSPGASPSPSPSPSPKEKSSPSPSL